MPHRTRRPSRSENRFRQREVSRALRAAHEAGEAIDRVEIDPHTGTIRIGTSPSETVDLSETHPLDKK